MVAVIHASSSLRRVLTYNEQKVQEGVAECLEAAYYLKGPDRLTFNEKLKRLQNLAALNERTKVNSVHISLNFDPSEKHDTDKLKQIAAAYVDKIGFGGQPYLLYQHFDSGHPHVHLLTTNIRPDGSRIELHHLAILKSEPARKELEKEFGLIRAEDSKIRKAYELKAVNAKVQYGKAATKRAIQNVLNHVLDSYKYASIPELNAVLNLYNVSAERGSEQSRVYINKGLVYRIRKEDGTMQGVPIKASDFYSKPTLLYLQEKFLRNAESRQKEKIRLKGIIDFALSGKNSGNLQNLISSLKAKGIDVVLRANSNKQVYGITYVDHNTKCVFNGSELGKTYSAKGILERINNAPGMNTKRPQMPDILTGKIAGVPVPPAISTAVSGSMGHTDKSNLLEQLMEHDGTRDFTPFELRGKKKKRKKRKSI